MSAAEKLPVLEEARQHCIRHRLGLTKARVRDRVRRAAADALDDRAPVATNHGAILVEERAAVIPYALAASEGRLSPPDLAAD